MRLSIVLVYFMIATYANQSFAWGLKEFGQEAASPVTTDAKYFLYTGTILTLTLLLFEDGVSRPFQDQQVKDKPLGETSKWGNNLGYLVPNALYAAGMGIAGQYGNSEASRRAIGMFKASAYAMSVTSALKYTIREPRPDNIQEKNSFPSGHSASAFSFSGYVAAEHGWGWGSAALLLSTFVGFSRINDNRHYLHDVVAGATIGWAYGWGISKLDKKNKDHVYIIPLIDSQTAGLTLNKEF
jgi:membrane-associated phospholipid phosphatase